MPTTRLGGNEKGLSSLFRPQWFCGSCPSVALLLPLEIFMMPPLMQIWGTWLQLRHFSPTRAIRSFTTPVRIWRPIVGPEVWFRQSCLSIACQIIFFRRGWSCWMVSSLLCPPTQGRHLWGRTSLLHLWQPFNLLPLLGSVGPRGSLAALSELPTCWHRSHMEF